MEIFHFCLEVIKREGKKFNVGIISSTASEMTAATAGDVNYDIAHNRCTFMYRFGPVKFMFSKECFEKFISNYENIFTLLHEWYANSNLTLCSLSKGPGLDYLALLSICYDKSIFKNVNIISKHGAWRNTVNIIQDTINEGYLKCLPPSVSTGNIKVIQGDPMLNFCEKITKPVSEADVMLMTKVLNQQVNSDFEKISRNLQEMFYALKPNALILCVDTKPSVAVIVRELLKIPGKFLHEPVHVNTIMNLENLELYKQSLGCLPVLSARGSFFVWQKSCVILLKSDTEFLTLEHNQNKNFEGMNDMHINEPLSKYDVENLNQIQTTFEEKVKDCLPIDYCTSNNSCSFKLNKQETALSSTISNFDYSSALDVKLKSSNSIDTSATAPLNGGKIEDSHAKEYSLSTNRATKKANKFTQTGDYLFEVKFSEDNTTKIDALKNKVLKLTTAVYELIKSDQLEREDSQYVEDMNQSCNQSTSKSTKCNHSHMSCTHPCPYHTCMMNPCVITRCCKSLHTENFSCDHTHTCMHQNVHCHASEYPCFSHVNFNPNMCYSNDNENPNLVIPLNNIKRDVLYEVLSVLTRNNS